jgi:NADPH-dependent 7-cyano-7-deazaguanine reductase QueF
MLLLNSFRVSEVATEEVSVSIELRVVSAMKPGNACVVGRS